MVMAHECFDFCLKPHFHFISPYNRYIFHGLARTIWLEALLSRSRQLIRLGAENLYITDMARRADVSRRLTFGRIRPWACL